MSIGRKLACSFGVIVALVVVACVMSLWATATLSKHYHAVSGPLIQQITAVDALRTAAADMHFSQTQYVLTLDGRADYERDHRTFQNALAKLREMTPQAERSQLRPVDAALKQFERTDEQLYAAARAHDAKRANALVMGLGDRRADELVESLESVQSRLINGDVAQSHRASTRPHRSCAGSRSCWRCS